MQEAEASPGRAVLRAFAVAIIVLIGAATSLPDILLPWHPFSGFGMQFDASGNIIGVDPGRAADRAGVRAGDRLDLAKTPLSSRRYLITGYGGAKDGTQADFAIQRGATERTVTLTATVRPRTLLDNLTDLLLMATTAAFIAISAALVLMRPSKMTWAFLMYGAFTGSTSVLFAAWVPLWGYIVYEVLIAPLAGLAWVALILFALRFPNDEATGWRARAQSIVLLSLAALVPFALWINAGALAALPPPDVVIDIAGFLAAGGFVFVAVIFGVTYSQAAATDRARLRWVMLGLLIGQAGWVAFTIVTSIPGVAVPLPIPAINIMNSLELFVPVSVAYAIVRHRVFDVRFVVGRAVVYGLLTTMLVVLIALLDFVVSRLLEQSHLATIGEVLAAIAIGVSLNSLHKRLEGFVDATLFRSRRNAEVRLRRVALGLIHAGSSAGVTRLLVDEPYAAYRLASAAVFVRDDGHYLRSRAIGWEDAHLDTLGADASIVLQLHASQGPIPVRDAVWLRGELPSGAHYPAVVLPVFVQNTLEAIAVYGAHASGEDLDPEEIEVLEVLMRSAGAAYDHIAGEVALARMATLEAEVQRLSALAPAQA